MWVPKVEKIGTMTLSEWQAKFPDAPVGPLPRLKPTPDKKQPTTQRNIRLKANQLSQALPKKASKALKESSSGDEKDQPRPKRRKTAKSEPMPENSEQEQLAMVKKGRAQRNRSNALSKYAFLITKLEDPDDTVAMVLAMGGEVCDTLRDAKEAQEDGKTVLTLSDRTRTTKKFLFSLATGLAPLKKGFITASWTKKVNSSTLRLQF
jgi:hypothetical protein